eukprot:3373313-Pleurochrysis_carterae.AAC.1
MRVWALRCRHRFSPLFYVLSKPFLLRKRARRRTTPRERSLKHHGTCEYSPFASAQTRASQSTRRPHRIAHPSRPRRWRRIPVGAPSRQRTYIISVVHVEATRAPVADACRHRPARPRRLFLHYLPSVCARRAGAKIHNIHVHAGPAADAQSLVVTPRSSVHIARMRPTLAAPATATIGNRPHMRHILPT